MNASQVYIGVVVVAVAAIFILIFLTNNTHRHKRLTPLASIAFAFVIFGIFFGENRLAGYSLMGVGIVLAIIDIYMKSKKRRL